MLCWYEQLLSEPDDATNPTDIHDWLLIYDCRAFILSYNAYAPSDIRTSTILHYNSTRSRNIWNATSFNCLSPTCRACDYVFIWLLGALEVIRAAYCAVYIVKLTLHYIAYITDYYLRQGWGMRSMPYVGLSFSLWVVLLKCVSQFHWNLMLWLRLKSI